MNLNDLFNNYIQRNCPLVEDGNGCKNYSLTQEAQEKVLEVLNQIQPLNDYGRSVIDDIKTQVVQNHKISSDDYHQINHIFILSQLRMHFSDMDECEFHNFSSCANRWSEGLSNLEDILAIARKLFDISANEAAAGNSTFRDDLISPKISKLHDFFPSISVDIRINLIEVLSRLNYQSQYTIIDGIFSSVPCESIEENPSLLPAACSFLAKQDDLKQGFRLLNTLMIKYNIAKGFLRYPTSSQIEEYNNLMINCIKIVEKSPNFLNIIKLLPTDAEDIQSSAQTIQTFLHMPNSVLEKLLSSNQVISNTQILALVKKAGPSIAPYLETIAYAEPHSYIFSKLLDPVEGNLLQVDKENLPEVIKQINFIIDKLLSDPDQQISEPLLDYLSNAFNCSINELQSPDSPAKINLILESLEKINFPLKAQIELIPYALKLPISTLRHLGDHLPLISLFDIESLIENPDYYENLLESISSDQAELILNNARLISKENILSVITLTANLGNQFTELFPLFESRKSLDIILEKLSTCDRETQSKFCQLTITIQNSRFGQNSSKNLHHILARIPLNKETIDQFLTDVWPHIQDHVADENFDPVMQLLLDSHSIDQDNYIIRLKYALPILMDNLDKSPLPNFLSRISIENLQNYSNLVLYVLPFIPYFSDSKDIELLLPLFSKVSSEKLPLYIEQMLNILQKFTVTVYGRERINPFLLSNNNTFRLHNFILSAPEHLQDEVLSSFELIIQHGSYPEEVFDFIYGTSSEDPYDFIIELGKFIDESKCFSIIRSLHSIRAKLRPIALKKFKQYYQGLQQNDEFSDAESFNSVFQVVQNILTKHGTDTLLKLDSMLLNASSRTQLQELNHEIEQYKTEDLNHLLDHIYAMEDSANPDLIINSLTLFSYIQDLNEVNNIIHYVSCLSSVFEPQAIYSMKQKFLNFFNWTPIEQLINNLAILQNARANFSSSELFDRVHLLGFNLNSFVETNPQQALLTEYIRLSQYVREETKLLEAINYIKQHASSEEDLYSILGFVHRIFSDSSLWYKLANDVTLLAKKILEIPQEQREELCESIVRLCGKVQGVLHNPLGITFMQSIDPLNLDFIRKLDMLGGSVSKDFMRDILTMVHNGVNTEVLFNYLEDLSNISIRLPHNLLEKTIRSPHHPVLMPILMQTTQNTYDKILIHQLFISFLTKLENLSEEHQNYCIEILNQLKSIADENGNLSGLFIDFTKYIISDDFSHEKLPIIQTLASQIKALEPQKYSNYFFNRVLKNINHPNIINIFNEIKLYVDLPIEILRHIFSILVKIPIDEFDEYKKILPQVIHNSSFELDLIIEIREKIKDIPQEKREIVITNANSIAFQLKILGNEVDASFVIQVIENLQELSHDTQELITENIKSIIQSMESQPAARRSFWGFERYNRAPSTSNFDPCSLILDIFSLCKENPRPITESLKIIREQKILSPQYFREFIHFLTKLPENEKIAFADAFVETSQTDPIFQQLRKLYEDNGNAIISLIHEIIKNKTNIAIDEVTLVLDILLQSPKNQRLELCRLVYNIISKVPSLLNANDLFLIFSKLSISQKQQLEAHLPQILEVFKQLNPEYQTRKELKKALEVITTNIEHPQFNQRLRFLLRETSRSNIQSSQVNGFAWLCFHMTQDQLETYRPFFQTIAPVLATIQKYDLPNSAASAAVAPSASEAPAIAQIINFIEMIKSNQIDRTVLVHAINFMNELQRVAKESSIEINISFDSWLKLINLMTIIGPEELETYAEDLKNSILHLPIQKNFSHSAQERGKHLNESINLLKEILEKNDPSILNEIGKARFPQYPDRFKLLQLINKIGQRKASLCMTALPYISDQRRLLLVDILSYFTQVNSPVSVEDLITIFTPELNNTDDIDKMIKSIKKLKTFTPADPKVIVSKLLKLHNINPEYNPWVILYNIITSHHSSFSLPILLSIFDRVIDDDAFTEDPIIKTRIIETAVEFALTQANKKDEESFQTQITLFLELFQGSSLTENTIDELNSFISAHTSSGYLSHSLMLSKEIASIPTFKDRELFIKRIKKCLSPYEERIRADARTTRIYEIKKILKQYPIAQYSTDVFLLVARVMKRPTAQLQPEDNIEELLFLDHFDTCPDESIDILSLYQSWGGNKSAIIQEILNSPIRINNIANEHLLNKLANIDSDRALPFLQSLNALITENDSIEMTKAIIDFLATRFNRSEILPDEQLADFIKELKKLIRTDNLPLNNILDLLSQKSNAHNISLIRDFNSLLSEIDNAEKKQAIINFFPSLLSIEKFDETILQLLKPFLHKLAPEEILKFASTIKNNLRSLPTTVFTTLLPQIENFHSSQALELCLSDFLLMIKRLQHDQSHLNQVYTKITANVELVIKVYNKISFPILQLEAVANPLLGMAYLLTSNLPDRLANSLDKFINQIPNSTAQGWDLLFIKLENVAKRHDEYLITHFASITNKILALPQEITAEQMCISITILLDCLNIFYIDHNKINLIHSICNHTQNISSDRINHFTDQMIISHCPQLFWLDLVQQDSRFLEDFENQLYENLDSLRDEREALNSARNIDGIADRLGLDIDGRLMQLVFSIISAADQHQNDPLNPYTVFNKLQTWKDSPLPEVPARSSIVSLDNEDALAVQSLQEPLQQRRLKLNIQNAGQFLTTDPFKSKDLPDILSYEKLEDIREDIRKKITNPIYSHIAQMYEDHQLPINMSIEELKSKILSYDSNLESVWNQHVVSIFGERAPTEIIHKDVYFLMIQEIDHIVASTINRQIEETFGQSLTALTQVFFSSEMLRNFAIKPADPEKEVSNMKAYFHKIIEHIQNTSQERVKIPLNPDDLESPQILGLTHQEQALLNIARMVQNCTSGQTEGIHIAYNYLDSSSKYARHEASEDEHTLAIKKQFIDAISVALERLCSHDNAFFQELKNYPHIVENQQVHQAIYVKNVVFAVILKTKTSIEMDRYTAACLNPELESKSLEEFLSIFYKHFTPEDLIHIVQEAFNNITTIDEKSNLARHISRFIAVSKNESIIREYLGLSHEEEVDYSYIEMQFNYFHKNGDEFDDLENITINKKVAALLLESLGLIEKANELTSAAEQ